MKQLLLGVLILTVALIVADLRFGTSEQSLVFVTPTPFQQVIGVSDKATQGFTTSIEKVVDGDTVETKDRKKVRYIGINAPETGQPYGKEAMDFNKRLVFGKTVRIVYDQQQKDQYGRILGYVYVGSMFVNLEMLKKGWAIAEPVAPDTLYQGEFAKAEKQAQQTCQGLWSDTCMPLTNSCLKISTIQYNAPGIDDQNLNGEWVEIVNDCETRVDLSGWLLKDSSATNAYTFPAISLDPQQSLRLHSGCGTNTPSDLYWQCPTKQHAIWNNTGDEAMLFDTHGKLLSVYKY